MSVVRYVRKTDLARNTRQVINNVLRGQPAVVGSHGQPEVAIIDIVDYYIVSAVMRYYGRRPSIDAEAGLDETLVVGIHHTQARYDLVLAHFLSESISLGRAAELLEIPWPDLRARFLRLDVPMRVGPVDLGGVEDDIAGAEEWMKTAQI